MTDKELYNLCKKYGENALMWRRKFTGMLLEVNRRRLYEKKGFGSIFEFAKKLCGLSEEQVRRVLNLEERFKDKPTFHQVLISGEASVNKLARIASVVTPGNETFWVEKVQQLPKSALETLVKDVKIENQNGLFEPKTEEKSVHGHRLEELSLESDVKEELLELQRKGIDVSQVLREFLEQRKLEIAREKEYGTKRSIEHCAKPATTIHHTQRFALGQNHNPEYLAPLCREHHFIAHAIDVKAQVGHQVLVFG